MRLFIRLDKYTYLLHGDSLQGYRYMHDYHRVDTWHGQCLKQGQILPYQQEQPIIACMQ